ncbi:hypothetical protein CHGG_00342 [Chaetomium globosum CBS 148.51]|uniref:MOSC domain-containing protein n=1 Tax=Chaetomium globosum (strain ATCC 6205 / CBS 148.51 / DSM 1962 / NBRC 6347 / NRRL 1970) TaxID=306901 RepID=Q2HHG2_CHAGB|nr:uncharacterized protein CHGG_00342 [Chaetomium globosum CBS 148.51]EAQ92107.1 hypothetical protein CHGG_00342 [Chaetomium globosum CBS 148.51]
MSVHALALSAFPRVHQDHCPATQPSHRFSVVEGDCHLGVCNSSPKKILDARDLAPGQIGENVTTVGINLLALGKGTRLHFLPPPITTTLNGNDNDSGAEDEVDLQTPHAVVVIQGLRNPCPQIDRFRPGLKELFVVRDGERRIVGRTAGVMGTVEVGGEVRVGMRVVVEEAEGGFAALDYPPGWIGYHEVYPWLKGSDLQQMTSPYEQYMYLDFFKSEPPLHSSPWPEFSPAPHRSAADEEFPASDGSHRQQQPRRDNAAGGWSN